MKRIILAALLALGLLMPAIAAEPTNTPLPKASAASVPGLELPPDQTVDPSEGFVNIVAKTKGEVKWLVVANVKIKYLSYGQNIIVSVPNQPGITVNVFAVAVVDGKLTDFARTNLQVAGTPSPQPQPQPPGPTPQPPQPGPAAGPLHVTFLVDMSQVTPELAALLNSQTLRAGVTNRGNWFRLYDINSPIVAQKKLDGVAASLRPAAMIVQTGAGQVLYAQPIPKTENEIFTIINQLMGK